MPFFYLLLLLHVSTFLFSQEERLSAGGSVAQKILAAYEREAQATEHLSQVRAQIRQSLPTQEALLEFDEFFSGLVKRDRNLKSLSKELREWMMPILTADSLAQLVSTWQLLKLQNLRLVQHDLTPDYLTAPQFQDTSVIFQYLSFFNIQASEKVAELGAGSGWLSLILAMLYEDVNFYINELGQYSLRQVQRNISLELTKAQLARCQFVTGSFTSTGLEMEHVDLIIAVDAFHHFSDKIGMLKSIKWSLAKSGRLCLVEQVKTTGTGDRYCPQALEKWELELLLQQNGFVKSRERLLVSKKDRNIYLIEYVVNAL